MANRLLNKEEFKEVCQGMADKFNETLRGEPLEVQEQVLSALSNAFMGQKMRGEGWDF